MANRCLVLLLLVHLLPALSLGAAPTLSTHQEPNSILDLEQQLSVFLDELADAVQLIEQQQARQQQVTTHMQHQQATQAIAMQDQQQALKQLQEQRTTQAMLIQGQQQAVAEMQEQLNAMKGLITAGMTWELGVAEDADIHRVLTRKRAWREEHTRRVKEADKWFFFTLWCILYLIVGLVAYCPVCICIECFTQYCGSMTDNKKKEQVPSGDRRGD